MEYPHKIAKEFIKENKVPSLKILNKILFFCNIIITEDELVKLLNLPIYNINTNNNEEMIKLIKELVGSTSDKIQIPGIYFLTHIKSGKKYVGSSSQLGIRLVNYIKKKDRPEGLIRPLLYKEGMNNFYLDIIPIFDK